MLATARLPIAILFFMLACLFLAWGLWPSGQIVRTLTIEPDSVQAVSLTAPLLLRLTTPRFARLGDSHTIRLQFLPSGTWTASEASHVLVRARILIDGIEVSPNVAVSQPLVGKGSLQFYWHISARRTVTSQGRLWVHLEVLSENATVPDREQALAAIPLRVEVRSLLGLSGATTRGLGILAAAAGMLWILVPRPPATPLTAKPSQSHT